MDRKFLKRMFRFCFMILFATFITLYISQSAGYVEYENSKKVALTKRQIKKFEEDVASGKRVDVQKYLKVNERNYQNNLSKVGLKISDVTGSSVRKAVESGFKFLSDIAG